jgi:hypothetical protein
MSRFVVLVCSDTALYMRTHKTTSISATTCTNRGPPVALCRRHTISTCEAADLPTAGCAQPLCDVSRRCWPRVECCCISQTATTQHRPFLLDAAQGGGGGAATPYYTLVSIARRQACQSDACRLSPRATSRLRPSARVTH